MPTDYVKRLFIVFLKKKIIYSKFRIMAGNWDFTDTKSPCEWFECAFDWDNTIEGLDFWASINFDWILAYIKIEMLIYGKVNDYINDYIQTLQDISNFRDLREHELELLNLM